MSGRMGVALMRLLANPPSWMQAQDAQRLREAGIADAAVVGEVVAEPRGKILVV